MVFSPEPRLETVIRLWYIIHESRLDTVIRLLDIIVLMEFQSILSSYFSTPNSTLRREGKQQGKEAGLSKPIRGDEGSSHRTIMNKQKDNAYCHLRTGVLILFLQQQVQGGRPFSMENAYGFLMLIMKTLSSCVIPSCFCDD